MSDHKEAAAKLRRKVNEALAEYVHESPSYDEGTYPTNWILPFTTSSIDEEGDVLYSNNYVREQGDPNAHVGLASYAADSIAGALLDIEDEEEQD